MNDMETKQIINWLMDKADRAENPSWTRMMKKAAKRLKELDTENDELKQRLFVLKELDQPQKTAHWIIHITKDDIFAECSNCLTCGNPQWKVCPVCERKMVKDSGQA